MDLGISTSAGSGHRLAAPALAAHTLDGILRRMPSLPGFLDDVSLRPCLEEEVAQVQDDYHRAIARASVEYVIRDPAEAKDLGISDTALLYNEDLDALWTNREFQLDEFRVMRLTGVRPEMVVRVFKRVDISLCAMLSIMLELQYLWLDESPADIWWDAMSTLEKSSYSGIVFTDVNTPRFKSRLPIPLEEFVSQIDRHTDEVRDGLVEYWISAAGVKLKAYVAKIDNKKAVDMSPADEEEMSLLKDMVDDNDDDDFEFSQTTSNASEAQRAFKRRLGLEGLEGDLGHSHQERQSKPRTRADIVQDSAAVLLSRQLRTMCENSLASLVELLEKLSRPTSTAYCVFVIFMNLRP